MNEELKPCPFCGGEVQGYHERVLSRVINVIRCTRCTCVVTYDPPKSMEEMIDTWNKRKEKNNE